MIRMARDVAVIIALSLVWACKSSPTAVPPKECPDPCCGGNTSIDCAENPDVSCLEDADVCVARAYGCINGAFYLRPQAQLPPGCGAEGGTDADSLVLGDGPLGSADAVDTDASMEAPGDAETE